MSYALLVHKEAAGVHGGAITNAYTDRPITHIVNQGTAPNGSADVFVIALASNAFTLAAGTYRFRIQCKFKGPAGTRAGFYLYNNTDPGAAFTGVFSHSDTVVCSGTDDNNVGVFQGQITITSPKQFVIKDKASANVATNGRGTSSGSSSLGENEIYTIVEILKTA